MATAGPFKWNSLTNCVPQKEWDYTCSITGFQPVTNMIQSEMGISMVNASPLPFTSNVTGLGTYNDQANGNYYVVAFAGTKGYTGVYSASITFADRTGAVTISSATRYSDVLNAIFVATGGGLAPIKLTTGAGNFAVLGGSPPSANLVKTVNNFMFLANVPAAVATQSRVYWSNVTDPETWGAANFIDVRKNDGFGVTALANIGTDLYVFKNTSISKLGTTTFAVSGNVSTLGPLETINYYLGCNNGYNVCQLTDGRMAFLGSDGNLYIFDGNSLFNASSQIFPGADLRTFFGGSSAILQDCVVFENPYEKVIYLFPPGNQAGFGYDYMNNFWFNTVTFNGSTGGATANIYSLANNLGATAPRLILGSNNAIYISNITNASDNICTATMTVRVPYTNKGNLMRSAVFEFNSGTGASVSMRARAGYNALPSTFGFTSLSAASGRYVIPIAFNQLSTTNTVKEQNILVQLVIPSGSGGLFGDVYLSDEVQ